MRLARFTALLLVLAFLPLLSASASFDFSDDRFRGVFTTENLDAIIEEYELLDGWYWTSKARVQQTFHGVPDCPGWTDTAVVRYNRTGYIQGWYGCRWLSNSIVAENPIYGYGECFGFAQFIGYLLDGEKSPHGQWEKYYSLEDAGGLRVGDILRVEFKAGDNEYRHSAVVYAVNGDEVLFLQVSGTNYNRISVGAGFSDGYHQNVCSLEEIKKIRHFKILRSPLNQP